MEGQLVGYKVVYGSSIILRPIVLNLQAKRIIISLDLYYNLHAHMAHDCTDIDCLITMTLRSWLS